MKAFLNLGNEEKSTLAGSEFHTVTVLSVKKLRRFGLSHCALYSLYGCPLVADDVLVKYCCTGEIMLQTVVDYCAVKLTQYVGCYQENAACKAGRDKCRVQRFVHASDREAELELVKCASECRLADNMYFAKTVCAMFCCCHLGCCKKN